jgi:hypothetical protein
LARPLCEQFDWVRLYHGDDSSRNHQIATLTGALSDQPATHFTSGSASAMLVQFTSNDAIGSEGFEASYTCRPRGHGDEGGGGGR